ncbi:nuclear transport factor 2 family protein [Streptomyces sp. NPDC020681]|uniref:nuclear transport factor 2 family protein n=1 Tax=Streptomyces sp. NPDC020681 TaxID=3365083 RepID=UPI0037AE6A3B
MTTTTRTPAAVHPNTETLRTVYADLNRIENYISDDVLLHRANRTVEDPHPLVGKDAVMAHEHALLDAAGGTLVMDVQHIVANDHFGAVLGVLRIRHPREAATPFCGLWRFENGRIVEHWENAYDAPALAAALTPPNNT